jgi:hypothetical protein
MASRLYLLLLVARVAWAADPDPTSLYVLSTDGSSKTLKVGQTGTFVLSIRTVPGAHVSDEAPLKLLLSGSGGIQPAKQVLGRGDAKPEPKASGPADARFEVPLVAGAKGPGAVQAQLTFFVCTDTLCSRQQKTLNVPVSVD